MKWGLLETIYQYMEWRIEGGINWVVLHTNGAELHPRNYLQKDDDEKSIVVRWHYSTKLRFIACFKQKYQLLLHNIMKTFKENEDQPSRLSLFPSLASHQIFQPPLLFHQLLLFWLMYFSACFMKYHQFSSSFTFFVFFYVR